MRGSGRTTKQMEEAPIASVFVWPVPRSIGYAKDLAAYLGRGDLDIIPPDGLERLKGTKRRSIIVDHAASDHPKNMTSRHWDIVEVMKL